MTVVIRDYQQLVQDIEDEINDIDVCVESIIDIVMEAIEEVSTNDKVVR